MSTTTPELEPIPVPEEPPLRRLPPGEWIRTNLVYSPAGVVMTIAFGAFALWALYKLLRFVLVSAEWEIIIRNLTLFMAGRYPRGELWRIWAALFLITFVLAAASGARAKTGDVSLTTKARRWWPVGLFAIVIATLVRTWWPIAGIAGLIATAATGRWSGKALPARARRWTPLIVAVGLITGFELVARIPEGVDRWGGLLLTLYLALMGIALSAPIGLLLALGRRSTLPAVRVVSVAWIELFRGVPLVTVLFMGDLLIGFILPPGSSKPGAITRALIGLVLFTSAYLAEIYRGGLQSVPKGQIEAARALGLSGLRTTTFIVLPQALRAVIPAIVGQFISLFKDTSLVATIGSLELLRVAQTVTKQPDFLGQGLHAETLLFVSFIYWVGAYWMSRASQRLEKRLAVGER